MEREPEPYYVQTARILLTGVLALGACSPRTNKTQEFASCEVEKVEYILEDQEILRFHLGGNCREVKVLISGTARISGEIWEWPEFVDDFDEERYTLDVNPMKPITNDPADLVQVFEDDRLIFEWVRETGPTA